MGHIELASPVAHIWYLRSLPSRIGLMLDMTLREIEQVLYFERYIVIDGGLSPLEKGQLLSEDLYQQHIEEHGADIKASMGAEAIMHLLSEIELEKTFNELKEEIANRYIKDSKLDHLLNNYNQFWDYFKSNTPNNCSLIQELKKMNWKY